MRSRHGCYPTLPGGNCFPVGGVPGKGCFPTVGAKPGSSTPVKLLRMRDLRPGSGRDRDRGARKRRT